MRKRIAIMCLAILIFLAVNVFAEQYCTPDDCPFGYQDKGVTCSLNGLDYQCKRECYRSGGCSNDWSGWNYKYKECYAREGERCVTESVMMDSDFCYQFYTKVTGNFAYLNSQYQRYVVALNTWGDARSSCSNQPVSVETDIKNYGRGVDDYGYVGAGEWYNCGSASISSDKLSVWFYYRVAEYVKEDTKFETCSGSLECLSPADCGKDGYVGNKYCSNGNVVQKYRTYYCSLDHKCSFSDREEIIETCDYGCSNGECIIPECISGDKCVGNIYYVCENYKWVEKGIVKGKCGVMCISDADCPSDEVIEKTCIGNSVYETVKDYSCINYQCQSKQVQKLVETCDYGCSNGECIIPECMPGDDKCVGNIYYVCENYKWVEKGKVVGKCGVEEKCTSDADCPEGYYCDIDSGNCLKERSCINDNDCPEGYYCDTSTGKCMKEVSWDFVIIIYGIAGFLLFLLLILIVLWILKKIFEKQTK